jgi:ornithine carbamoyltransferase
MSGIRHFLDLDVVEAAELRLILDAVKQDKKSNGADRGRLTGKTLAMIFEKPSTRTRVSFEVAMKQLGGECVILRPDEMQLQRGETVADTARVLSRFVDAIMLRTGAERKLRELAEWATVPVINGLTDRSHPCQIMADVLTFEEHRGPIAGRTVAWSGDSNNVCNSWIHAAVQLDFTLKIASPPELSPCPKLMEWVRGKQGKVIVTHDPLEAVTGADLVATDCWVSMNSPTDNRHNLLAAFQVNAQLMSKAAPDALFMHCLPAHRGEEVTDEVMDGPQSVVWDEAENRLHVQKGILSWCLAQA